MTESDLRKLIDEAVKSAIDDKIEEIADKVEQRFYARFGSTIATNILKLLGIVTVAAAIWFAGKGYIK